MERAYEELGNAVVLQAVKDYRKAYKHLMRYPHSLKAKHEVGNIEAFFRNQRFNLFTGLDGEMILDRLQEELESGVKR